MGSSRSAIAGTANFSAPRRSGQPDEVFCMDTRLITGVKVYLHAAIDNFSRRILVWRLTQSSSSSFRIPQRVFSPLLVVIRRLRENHEADKGYSDCAGYLADPLHAARR